MLLRTDVTNLILSCQGKIQTFHHSIHLNCFAFPNSWQHSCSLLTHNTAQGSLSVSQSLLFYQVFRTKRSLSTFWWSLLRIKRMIVSSTSIVNNFQVGFVLATESYRFWTWCFVLLTRSRFIRFVRFVKMIVWLGLTFEILDRKSEIRDLLMKLDPPYGCWFGQRII